MALLTPKPNQIQHAQIPGATVNDNMLKALLQGANIGASGAERQMAGDQAIQKQTQQQESEKQSLAQLLGQAKPGQHLSMNGASVSSADPSIKQTARDEQLAKDYSKRLTDASPVLSALQELQVGTANKEGKDGVLTSTQATIPGTGKFLSAVPTAAVGAVEGLGSLIGKDLVPKGSTDSRKAAERLILGYAKMMGGARGVNPSMIKAEKEATGWISSGDPQLVAKGIRSLARMARQNLNTIGAGYPQRVRDQVHGAMGGNPAEFLNNIPEDGVFGSGLEAPAEPVSGAVTSSQSPTPARGISLADIDAEIARRKGGR
jgi:hypothetical protein